MRINKIEIRNFRGISDVCIDDFDKNLNLIIGINGSGKSSLLDAIALSLQPFTAKLMTKGGFGLQLSYTDIKKRTRGCNLAIKINEGKDFSWSLFRTNNLDVSDKSDFSELNKLVEPLRNALDDYEKPVCLPVIAHYGVNRTLVQNVSVTASRYKINHEERKSNDTYIKWWDRRTNYMDFRMWFKDEEDDENRIRVENPEYRDRGLQAIREAMKIVFPEYEDMRVVNRYSLALKKGGEEFLLDQLSDGEKCYISLLCDIVRRLTIANPTGDILNGEGVVLIDEIDLHLHPSWEASVMEKLNKVFPNIQFIVTAHSPLVASHFNGNIYAIDGGDVTKLPRLFGLDYSTILQDWMMSDSGNKQMSILAGLYKTYKKHKMTEQADVVYQKILKATNGDVTSPFFLKLFNE